MISDIRFKIDKILEGTGLIPIYGNNVREIDGKLIPKKPIEWNDKVICVVENIISEEVFLIRIDFKTNNIVFLS